MTTRAVFEEGLKDNMPANAAWARIEGVMSASPYTTLTDDNVDEETGLESWEVLKQILAWRLLMRRAV